MSESKEQSWRKGRGYIKNPISPYLLTTFVSVPAYLKFQEKARNKRRESILLLEHPPCITSGTNSNLENLLWTKAELQTKGIDCLSLLRGGDFTAHEPGQWVGYLHIDLRLRRLSLGDYLSQLEVSLIQSIYQKFGLKLQGDRKAPGLYDELGNKLLSIGILAKSHFTSFGFALNVENSLETFSYIRPCGISAERMSSLRQRNNEMFSPSTKKEWFGIFLEKFFEGLPPKRPMSD